MEKLAETQKKERPAIPSLPNCVEYLLTCSRTDLQGFGLARMNAATNLLRELSEILDRLVQARAEAELAFWLLELGRSRVPAVLHRPSVPVRRALPARRKMLKARKEKP